MRIRELTLRNVKLLADQTFSFARPGGSFRTWTARLGDNGVRKTTVLKAIALARSGAKMARTLVQDAAAYVRQDRPELGAISILQNVFPQLQFLITSNSSFVPEDAAIRLSMSGEGITHRFPDLDPTFNGRFYPDRHLDHHQAERSISIIAPHAKDWP